MRPNETPVFTELYQRYGLMNLPAVRVFDSALYVGQPGENGELLIPSSQLFSNEVDQVIRAYHSKLKNQALFIDPKDT